MSASRGYLLMSELPHFMFISIFGEGFENGDRCQATGVKRFRFVVCIFLVVRSRVWAGKSLLNWDLYQLQKDSFQWSSAFPEIMLPELSGSPCFSDYIRTVWIVRLLLISSSLITSIVYSLNFFPSLSVSILSSDFYCNDLIQCRTRKWPEPTAGSQILRHW